MRMKNGKKRGLSVLLATMAAAALLLSGCGGGSDGAVGPTGPAGPAGAAGVATTPVVDATTLTSDQWAALQPKITVNSVTIPNGPPVVKFSVADNKGNAIGNLDKITSQSSTANYAGHPNFAFNLVKLIPPSNGSPSRWVNLMVISADTKTNPAKTPASHPTSENIGTLVATGNGSYQYTFWTDVTQVNTLVQTLKPTASPYSFAQLGAGSCPSADLCYDATKTHRFTMSLNGAAPGTGTNTPTAVQTIPVVNMIAAANAVYDFIPATGALANPNDPSQSREIVAYQNCYQCHQNFSQIHGGARLDTKLCVTCHTGQLNWEGVTEATYSGTTFTPGSATNQLYGFSMYVLPNWIHKIHMGDALTMKGYNAVGVPGVNGLTSLNDITYPQDQRNCVKCHTGTAVAQSNGNAAPTVTPQGDNWKNVPSRMACGGCHDGINFATGQGKTISGVNDAFGHVGGAQADDSKCAICHDAASIATVYHVPVMPPGADAALVVGQTNTHTNSSSVAGYTGNLPAGAANITYVINSVTVTNGHPVITFKFQNNGQDVAFNPKTASSLMTGFVGSPSIIVAMAVPEADTPAVTAPADFNYEATVYLNTLWLGTGTGNNAGTLSATPNANGYYTATLTGINIPSNAAMVTAGIGYGYGAALTSLPLTQTNLSAYPYYATNSSDGKYLAGYGGLTVEAQDVWMVATGYTPRRAIVDTARCNNCHAALGVFQKAGFHAGQRNNAETCSMCHNANGSDTGWAYDSRTFIHGLHSTHKRVDLDGGIAYGWQSNMAAKITYPGNIDDCEQCHLPDTYNFGSTYTKASSGATPSAGGFNPATAVNMLYPTAAAGTYTAGTVGLSPDVSPGTAYGAAFSYNANTGVATPAAATTLVHSPIAGACFSCHASSAAKSHMKANGGSIYAPRATALATTEQCLLCHAAGKVADVKAVHFKGAY